MRITFFVICILFLCSIGAGCISPPTAISPQEAALLEVTPTKFVEPYERITLSPIRDVPHKLPLTVATPKGPESDPIIGSWKLMGSSGYQCGAVFLNDNTGVVDCSIAIIPLANEKFTWVKTPDEFNFMRNYEVKRNNNITYTILYSDRTREIVSDLLPENSYLQKVD
jgi:hypothetical protein